MKLVFMDVSVYYLQNYINKALVFTALQVYKYEYPSAVQEIANLFLHYKSETSTISNNVSTLKYRQKRSTQLLVRICRISFATSTILDITCLFHI